MTCRPSTSFVSLLVSEQLEVILDGLVLRGKTDQAILGYLRNVGINVR